MIPFTFESPNLTDLMGRKSVIVFRGYVGDSINLGVVHRLVVVVDVGDVDGVGSFLRRRS